VPGCISASIGVPAVTYDYSYNGMGDRTRQSVDALTTTYQLDLAAGLTQVLSDGTATYLYGLGRIGEIDSAWSYYTTDALGSVRQLTDNDGALLLAQSYEPYGTVLTSVGQGQSMYGFTGEWGDASGMTYLRARYMQPGTGSFISRDTWRGHYDQANSMNRWTYAQNNPIIYVDPSGYFTCEGLPHGEDREYCRKQLPLFTFIGNKKSASTS
jgi:RHS repeat-associated protein